MKNWMLAALLLPLGSPTVPWSEVETGDRLVLSQKVELGETGLSFSEGTKLQLLSIEPLALPGAPLLYLTLDQSPCEKPDAETGIEIVVPKGNAESSSVGIELTANCRWGIYLEQKDVFNPSLFGRDLFR